MATNPVPAGSPEAKVIGELLVAAGKAGLQYAPEVDQYVEGFDPQAEAAVTKLESALEAKLPAPLNTVAATLFGLINTYVDANINTFEGDAFAWLCNEAIAEGTKLQA